VYTDLGESKRKRKRVGRQKEREALKEREKGKRI
jgi:hypothetical protein